MNWADTFPFGFLTKFELLDLYGVDLPSQLASLPSLEITSRLENLPHLQDFDLDENLVHSINSNYRKVSDLAKISTDQMFSLFHVNIRSLSKHFGELQSLINSTKIPFDIIGETESKQLLNTDFAVDVSLDGYHIHSKPTKSTHGGVVMYVNKHLSSIKHGGTRTFFLWQRWPSRMHIYCSVGPPECIFMTSLAFKNAYLWLSWLSLMRGYQDIFSIVGTIEWQVTERSEGASTQRLSEAREHPPVTEQSEGASSQ